MKQRLDILLVEQGLAASREKAKAMIMSGVVFVNGQREDKAGSTFDEKQEIVVKGKTLKYVSRGGLKLEKAMNIFGVSLEGKVSMDVGASTGGFTDCMLQNGAVKVYSIDVGYGQLDWGLRNDPRVVCMEKTNIRYVVPEDIQEAIRYLDMKEVNSGSNVVIFPLENDSYIKDFRVIDDSTVVSPLQIYLDCMQIKGRGEEMADAVLKKDILR